MVHSIDVVTYGLGLVFAAYAIAALVFSITSLVQATAHPPGAVACERDMAIWLVVYGSMYWVWIGFNVIFFLCVRETMLRRLQFAELPRQPLEYMWRGFNTLVGLFFFSWYCYGVNLSLARTNELSTCNPGMFYWLSLTSQFMLWFLVALLGLVVLAAMAVGCWCCAT